jgi:hypothetical protein
MTGRSSEHRAGGVEQGERVGANDAIVVVLEVDIEWPSYILLPKHRDWCRR